MGIDIKGNIVEQVLERYNKSAQDKKIFIEDILLNQQYIRGKQNSFFDSFGAFHKEALQDSGEDVEEVFNRMLPIYTKRIKILSRNMPNVKVKPIGNQIKIEKKTKITNALIEHVKYDNQFKVKYNKFIKKLETYSLAFYKIIYDYRLGDLQKLELKRTIAKNKDKGRMNSEKDSKIIVKMMRSGGIEIYVGDSNEIYFENIRSSNLNDNEYIIQAKAFHVDDIRKAFGVKVKPQQIDSLTNQEMGKSASSRRNNDTNTNIDLKDYAMVIEYYERPTHNNPNGRKIVVAGDKMIDSSTLPYRCGVNGTYDYNFVIAQQVPQEGFIYGENTYTQLRPVQRRYNSNRNLIAKFIKKRTIGTILSPEDSLEDVNVITNEIGKVVTYNPMFGIPTELQMGDLPNDIWNELSTCEREFVDIGGVTTTSGQTNANIRSGEQMQIMNQNDEGSVGITVDSIIMAHTELFKKVLRIIKEKCEYLPISIYENGMDKLLVKPENILEGLHVENAGVIGLTEQQQTAKINAAIQLGVLNKEGQNQFGPEHVDLILRESGMSHIIPQLSSEAKFQIEYINRENNKLLFSSKTVNVNDFDDDALHISYHNRLLMSSEFEEEILTGGNGDQIKKAIDEHVSQHRQRLQKAQMLNQILAAQQKQA